jgi:hypothetical protein
MMKRLSQATCAAKPFFMTLDIRVWSAGLAAAGMLMLPIVVQAQADDAGYSQGAWTGRVQDTAAARKEAAAALAEGRRECARQAEGRAACLKQVEANHQAALQRLKVGPAAASTPAKAPKPVKAAQPG